MKVNTKATELLFVYGTLQDTELQQILFGCSCRMRRAALPGWSLYAASEGWLFIKPDMAGSVSGRLLELDAAALRAADLWEEVPLLYQREKLLVIMPESEALLAAWAYTRRDGKGMPYAGGQTSLLERQVMLQAAAKRIISPCPAAAEP